MKKYLAIIVVALMLTSCTNETKSNVPNNLQSDTAKPQQENTIPKEDNKSPTNQSEIDNNYFGKYQLSDDGFSDHVKDNKLDKDYEIESTKFQASPNFNTQGWVELESKYLVLWDKELNNTYSKLIKKLIEKEQIKLREAQRGWVDFNIHESEFVRESWDDLGLGSMGRVQLVMASKDRIRERTLQLMEYYYMLGGAVEFLYQGSSK